MNYSTYLFDLDGTLYSRDLLVEQLVEEQQRAFKNQLVQIDSSVYINRVIELDAHGYFPKPELYAQIGQEFDLPSGLQTQLLEHFWESYDSYLALPQDTLQTLETLCDRGVQLGIVTNGQTQRQNKKIDALGIREYFHTIVVSETEGFKKPHPDIFHRAINRTGSAQEETVFIGDHPIADIDGARGAGLAAIWKSVPYWSMTRNDVRVVEHLTQLLD